MSTYVELKNVSLTYHSPETETLAIDNLNMSVNEGEIVGLVGTSGCGKTTILSLISGILTPSSGSVTAIGENAIASREATGYMLQKDELFGWRTIMSNVLLGLEIKKRKTKENIEFAIELLKKYNLYEFKDFYPCQLSGGMRQRVALIRTLVLSPKILLLDEPFSALDFQTRLNVVEDVHKIIKVEHKTAVFVTHDISEAISMCDKVCVLSPRPTNIKATYDLSIFGDDTPFARRENTNFPHFFDSIWKDLQTEK